MSLPTAEEFLSGGTSYPALKFANIGDQFVGTIIDEPRPIERPKYNKEGTEIVLPINLLLDGDGDEKDRQRTLWVAQGFMSKAIGDACKTAGVSGVAVGGKLGIKHTELRDTGKGNPAKVFSAQYQPPTPSTVSVEEIF